MTFEPSSNIEMLVGGVIVNDMSAIAIRGSLASRMSSRSMDSQARRTTFASNHHAVENVHGGERRRRAAPRIVVRDGCGATLFSGLRTACDPAHHFGSFHPPTGRWRVRAVSIEPDDVAQSVEIGPGQAEVHGRRRARLPRPQRLACARAASCREASNRPKNAPETLEKTEFAPGNGMAAGSREPQDLCEGPRVRSLAVCGTELRIAGGAWI